MRKTIEHVAVPIEPPSRDYDAILADMLRLGLIETLKHGEHEYGRFTQLGYDIIWASLQMYTNRFDPGAKLDPS